MTTSVDIRVLVAVACILLFFSACLAAFLRGAWTERFRHAANLYGASLAALIVAALGVFLSQDAPLVVSAVLIITGAHFSIVFGYLSLHEMLRAHPAPGRRCYIATDILGGCRADGGARFRTVRLVTEDGGLKVYQAIR